MRCSKCYFFSSQTWREFATTDFGSFEKFYFSLPSKKWHSLILSIHLWLPFLNYYFTLFDKIDSFGFNSRESADHREVFASLRLDRSICRPIVTCIMNNSERWITRLVRRWRAQPTAWISVNCRISWTSTSWTHIAASGFPRGHAWPRVGLANYRCIFFVISVFGRLLFFFL